MNYRDIPFWGKKKQKKTKHYFPIQGTYCAQFRMSNPRCKRYTHIFFSVRVQVNCSVLLKQSLYKSCVVKRLYSFTVICSHNDVRCYITRSGEQPCTILAIALMQLQRSMRSFFFDYTYNQKMVMLQQLGVLLQGVYTNM